MTKASVLVIAICPHDDHVVRILPWSGDGAHCARMNLMTGVIASVKHLETVFCMKRFINPYCYYYHYYTGGPTFKAYQH